MGASPPEGWFDAQSDTEADARRQEARHRAAAEAAKLRRQMRF
jgi:hypothetical protein